MPPKKATKKESTEPSKEVQTKLFTKEKVEEPVAKSKSKQFSG